MLDSSHNPESPRNPGWSPRAIRSQAAESIGVQTESLQNTTSVSKSVLRNAGEAISRETQIGANILKIGGAGLIVYSATVSSDIRGAIAGALVISAGRIASKYFR